MSALNREHTWNTTSEGISRPCYASLRNNVSTTEMEVTFQKWPPGTQEFVPHHVLADYIQEAVRSGGEYFQRQSLRAAKTPLYIKIISNLEF